MSVKDLFMNDVDETSIPCEVAVSGKLPNWLIGTYYKVGNGKYTLPSGFQMNHIIDGYCIIYQYEIENNTVRFRSKYLNSDAFTEAMEYGKPTHAEPGTRQYSNPNKNAVSRALSNILPTNITDNNCANLLVYRDQIYAIHENHFLHQIDPDTLQSVAKIDVSNVGILGSSGHYLPDGLGGFYNFSNTIKVGSLKPVIIHLPAPSKEELLANSEITFNPKEHIKFIATIPKASMMSISPVHSFGMSEKYFLIPEQSLKANLLVVAAGLIQGKVPLECAQFKSDKKTKFRVISRSTGTVTDIKYNTRALHYMHIANMYEEDEYLILDIITYTSNEAILRLTLSNLRNNDIYQDELGTLHRFVLPLGNIKKSVENQNLVKISSTKATATKVKGNKISLTPEQLFDIPMDFIQINQKFIGRKYRFAYTFIVLYDHKYKKQLIKLDLETGEIKTWKSSNNDHFPTEPIFVPNPEGVDEDDGIIIVVLVEAGKKASVLLFLDAKSFTEIARAEFPCDANLGNHSTFVFKKDNANL